MKKLQNGRSMVEMIGVLAIIGVLSIGAIAGYSTAMMKYKFNKHVNSINMLINTTMLYKGKIAKKTDDEAIYLAEMFHKINQLPDGIVLDKTDTNYLRDIFNNKLWIYEYPDTRSGLGYTLENNSLKSEICINFMNIAKANSSQLYFFRITADNQYVYGDYDCSKNDKCLEDVTLTDMHTMCEKCKNTNQTCEFFFTWK